MLPFRTAILKCTCRFLSVKAMKNWKRSAIQLILLNEKLIIFKQEEAVI